MTLGDGPKATPDIAHPRGRSQAGRSRSGGDAAGFGISATAELARRAGDRGCRCRPPRSIGGAVGSVLLRDRSIGDPDQALRFGDLPLDAARRGRCGA